MLILNTDVESGHDRVRSNSLAGILLNNLHRLVLEIQRIRSKALNPNRRFHHPLPLPPRHFPSLRRFFEPYFRLHRRPKRRHNLHSRRRLHSRSMSRLHHSLSPNQGRNESRCCRKVLSRRLHHPRHRRHPWHRYRHGSGSRIRLHLRGSLCRSNGGARPEDERAARSADGVRDDRGEFGGGGFRLHHDYRAGWVRWGGAESGEVFRAGGVERGTVVGRALGVLGGAVCGVCGLLWIFCQFADGAVGWSEGGYRDFENGRQLLAVAPPPEVGRKVRAKCLNLKLNGKMKKKLA